MKIFVRVIEPVNRLGQLAEPLYVFIGGQTELIPVAPAFGGEKGPFDKDQTHAAPSPFEIMPDQPIRRKPFPCGIVHGHLGHSQPILQGEVSKSKRLEEIWVFH